MNKLMIVNTIFCFYDITSLHIKRSKVSVRKVRP